MIIKIKPIIVDKSKNVLFLIIAEHCKVWIKHYVDPRADLFSYVTSSKHRRVSSDILVFLSMLLDFIYIIFAS